MPHMYGNGGQLYTIRAPLGNTAVTGVYALLNGKTQSIYEELLHAVMAKCQGYGIYPDPSHIVTDFEKASLGAITTILGEQVSTQGCFYHLTQSTWRKIQELGLSYQYKASPDIQHFVGMMDGLAFLQVADVYEGNLIFLIIV